jgi:hypothetical protein
VSVFSESNWLGALVRDKWSSLLDEGGFDIVEEESHQVIVQSTSLQVVVVHDPRGEVDVYAFPRGVARYDGWTYSGMVGRASVARLLEIALTEMRSDPAILRGDASYYARLAEENQASRKAWTAYYAGQGPRPSRRWLP